MPLLHLCAGLFREGPKLQLDKTRVAIRERGFLDIMDLAVRVTRGHLPAFGSGLAHGALPPGRW